MSDEMDLAGKQAAAARRAAGLNVKDGTCPLCGSPNTSAEPSGEDVGGSAAPAGRTTRPRTVAASTTVTARR